MASHCILISISPIKATKMAIIRRERETSKCWQGCGETGTTTHCWWECKMVQQLWKTVWRFLKKVNIELPHDPAIPLLGIYPREMKILYTKTCTWRLTAALCITAKKWKQLKCPSTDEWVSQMWYTHTVEYYLVIKRNERLIGASLAAQWLRIRLPVQGTRVRALVWEDPTCRGATKPMRHNYRACTLEPRSHNYWSPCATTTEALTPRPCALQREATAVRSPCTAMKSSPCSPQLEESPCAATKTQCSQK